MSKYHAIRKTYSTVLCSWLDEIEIQISDELREQVKKARNILKYNPHIRSLSLDVPYEFLNPEQINELHYACPFDIERIVISDIYVRYALQSTYSAMITAKYDFTHLIPHPVVEEFEKEEEAFQKELNEEG